MLQAKEIFQCAAKKLDWKVFLWFFPITVFIVLLIAVLAFISVKESRDKEFMDIYRGLGEGIVEYHLWVILGLVVIVFLSSCYVGLMKRTLYKRNIITHLCRKLPELGEGELEQESEACFEKNKKFIQRYWLVNMLVGSLFSGLFVQLLYELYILFGLSYLWVGLLFLGIGLLSIFFFALFENNVFDVICTDYLAEREDTSSAEEKEVL